MYASSNAFIQYIRTDHIIVNQTGVLSDNHDNDVIMSAMVSQITSLTIVYSAVYYSGEDQRKHQSSASPAFVRGIHRWPVNSPHKWPVTRRMFPFDDVIMGNRVSTKEATSTVPIGIGYIYDSCITAVIVRSVRRDWTARFSDLHPQYTCDRSEWGELYTIWHRLPISIHLPCHSTVLSLYWEHLCEVTCGQVVVIQEDGLII